MEILLIISLLVNLASLFCIILLIGKMSSLQKNVMKHRGSGDQEEFSRLRQEINSGVNSSVKNFADMTNLMLSKSFSDRDKYLQQICSDMERQQENLQKTMSIYINQQENRFGNFARESALRLDDIRSAVEKKLSYLQDDNSAKLDEIRKTVDEKLSETLNDRMTQSFKIVEDRLEQVYRGLGEMQTLASGVGDLKRVLSNVKTRGVLGEVQLGAILDEILSPEQYDKNVITKKNSQSFVEFAVKIPQQNSGDILYLPIDAKFPADAYTQLLDAYESGDPERVNTAANVLKNRIKSFAKDIRDKYLDPPHTTDFAIMFLPFEGLYAEVVNRGMVETLLREYRVNIAGPSTMAALLNSLQMGFKTFALQKRSAEVWNVLSAVKTEFDKFAQVLEVTQQRLEQANSELDKLVGVRTRQIRKTLSAVTSPTEFNLSDGQKDRE